MGPLAWLRYEEPAAQKAENMKTGQRPLGVSDEEWFGNGRYFDYCHWYDKKPDFRYGVFGRESQGHCSGRWRHNHQSARMRWYWASPLGKIVPTIWELWQFGPFILSAWLEKLGWYRLLERFGVDTSPR